MKLTLSWLKDHLDTDAPLEEITTKLSAIGLEVESVADPAAKLGAFRIARVLEAKPHPNADRLRVLQVEIAPGAALVEVVCGAPNARAGLVGVFAPLGTYIPGSGLTLEKKPVRGVVSHGMMCSGQELELSEDSDGIIELPPEAGAKVGARYVEAMGLDDPVIEVKLTPNRPDCTGVRGIARDLAAAGLGRLKPEPALGDVEGSFDCPIDIRLEFLKGAEDACRVFMGRYVASVANGPSPEWMRKRLTAVGLRPINALVDVTNYISQDRGRPLHVYDADKLTGAVRARLGREGESFLALDGKDYAVDETMCVIADDSGPLGLGGVIGGEATGCTEATRNVLIECAWFDPVRTATTGRKTGLVTDARYRFERGVDPASVRPGLDLATDMILKLAGGRPSRAKVAGREPIETRTIAFDLARVEKLTGLRLDDSQIKGILERLGFRVEGRGAKSHVTVPTWRPDVHGAADLVEEVVRIAGLDRVPSVPLPRAQGVTRGVLTEAQRRARRVRRTFAARGFVEAVTWSFIARPHARLFGGGADALELANPISSEMSSMRPSLLPGLLTAAQRNRDRGLADVALFELGQAYRRPAPEDQFQAAAGVRAGTARVAGAGRHWSGSAGAVDVYDVKADVFAALAAIGFDASKAQLTRDAPATFHPGRSATLRLGPKVVLAHFGELHPETLKALDVAGPVAAFEIFLDALPAEKRRGDTSSSTGIVAISATASITEAGDTLSSTGGVAISGTASITEAGDTISSTGTVRAKPPLAVSDLLPVRRDFAFVLDKAVPAGEVLRAATNADKQLVAGVSVFDVFEGGSLAAEGKKSLAIEVTLQPTRETLTDKDIEAVSQKIIAAVKQATGGEIRG